MSEKNLSRRSFIKGAAAGAVTVSVASLIPFSNEAHAATAPWVGNLPTKWDYDTDIVVVGTGGSGLCAAVEAARKGAKVLMLEKNVNIGGDMVVSAGVFYSAKTKYHIEAGITKGVEPADYWAYLSSGADDEPLKRVRDNQKLSPIYAAITKHNPKLMERNALESPSLIEFVSSFGVQWHPMNPVKPFQINAKSGQMAVLANNMMKEIQRRQTAYRNPRQQALC